MYLLYVVLLKLTAAFIFNRLPTKNAEPKLVLQVERPCQEQRWLRNQEQKEGEHREDIKEWREMHSTQCTDCCEGTQRDSERAGESLHMAMFRRSLSHQPRGGGRGGAAGEGEGGEDWVTLLCFLSRQVTGGWSNVGSKVNPPALLRCQTQCNTAVCVFDKKGDSEWTRGEKETVRGMVMVSAWFSLSYQLRWGAWGGGGCLRLQWLIIRWHQHITMGPNCQRVQINFIFSYYAHYSQQMKPFWAANPHSHTSWSCDITKTDLSPKSKSVETLKHGSCETSTITNLQ